MLITDGKMWTGRVSSKLETRPFPKGPRDPKGPREYIIDLDHVVMIEVSPPKPRRGN